MHLFTKQSTIVRDNIQDNLAYVVEIAQYVTEKTGVEVVPWATIYGAPVGTVSWSSRVASQAAMGAAQATLQADPGFNDRVKANAHRFEGPAEDSIGEFVALAGDKGTVAQYASIVVAQCAGGRIADAMSWGVDMTQYASKVTGADGAIVRGVYGPFATLVFISLYRDLEEVDAADAATSSDPTYLERLDQAGDLFLPGSATQRLIRRLA